MEMGIHDMVSRILIHYRWERKNIYFSKRMYFANKNVKKI